ncbi:MAG: carboxypeptidase-like regulatory domain-containing protein [Bacteroidetes bacterium]|nr:carboxypeptidase-like regulatory domain-containing protein [Bacteroidota bacterium]MBS1974114.1 carboxypeptidase-like regulatory domain-containing protein [Bacteroidota bacterium]
MKRLTTVIVALLISFTVFPQENTFTVTGKVIDAKTKQPMQNASVFCQNTTVGTITNADGKFFLRLKNGGYDLIASYTSYETQSMRISNGGPLNDSLIIEMSEKDKNMSEVVVAAGFEVADGWDKYGKFFIDNFIGTTPNASACTLDNKEALHFYYYKKRGKLKVKAKDALSITNNALGYRIRYQLDSFVYDYKTKVSIYTGYPLFEELQGSDAQKELWKKNRFISYIGSRLHFMRSYYDSTLNDEGFKMELLGANDKPTVIKNPYDSIVYSVDSGDAVINIKGRLRVTYTNHAPDPKYLEENRYPLTTPVQISALDITDGFVIEENGYFYEQTEVTNMGYWAWKKLAEQLPYDYNPE